MNAELNHLQLKNYLNTYIRNRNVATARIFKYLNRLTGSTEKAIEFLKNQGFTSSEIKRTIRSINREKLRYQNKIKTAMKIEKEY